MEVTEREIKLSKRQLDLGREIRGLPGVDDFVKSFDKSMMRNPDFYSCSYIPGHAAALEVFREEQQNNCSVLYMACSYGVGVKILEALGHDVKGIDLNNLAVNDAGLRGLNVSLENAFQICDNTIANGNFDIVTSRDFLRADYLESTQINRLLWIKHGLLREGGIAVCYSMLFDSETISEGSEWRLKNQETSGLPFKEWRKYSVAFSHGMTCFVDVFEK